MTTYMKNFLEVCEDLINDNEWAKVFARCLPAHRAELRKILKQAKIDFKYSIKIDGKEYMPIDDASKFVQQLVKDNALSFREYYNDKGKNGRKLKWLGIEFVEEVKDPQSYFIDKLEANNILYDYVRYENEVQVGGGWHARYLNALYIRLLDPEVIE